MADALKNSKGQSYVAPGKIYMMVSSAITHKDARFLGIHQPTTSYGLTLRLSCEKRNHILIWLQPSWLTCLTPDSKDDELLHAIMMMQGNR